MSNQTIPHYMRSNQTWDERERREEREKKTESGRSNVDFTEHRSLFQDMKNWFDSVSIGYLKLCLTNCCCSRQFFPHSKECNLLLGFEEPIYKKKYISINLELAQCLNGINGSMKRNQTYRDKYLSKRIFFLSLSTKYRFHGEKVKYWWQGDIK